MCRVRENQVLQTAMYPYETSSRMDISTMPHRVIRDLRLSTPDRVLLQAWDKPAYYAYCGLNDRMVKLVFIASVAAKRVVLGRVACRLLGISAECSDTQCLPPLCESALLPPCEPRSSSPPSPAGSEPLPGASRSTPEPAT